jgi:hypothetical protein
VSWQLLFDDAHVQCHVIQSVMSPLPSSGAYQLINHERPNWLAECTIKMLQLSKNAMLKKK